MSKLHVPSDNSKLAHAYNELDERMAALEATVAELKGLLVAAKPTKKKDAQ